MTATILVNKHANNELFLTLHMLCCFFTFISHHRKRVRYQVPLPPPPLAPRNLNAPLPPCPPPLPSTNNDWLDTEDDVYDLPNSVRSSLPRSISAEYNDGYILHVASVPNRNAISSPDIGNKMLHTYMKP